MSSERTIWVRVDAKLKYVAPVFLGLLIIYLYSSLVSPVLSKRILEYVEIAVITYFLSELVVKVPRMIRKSRFFTDKSEKEVNGKNK